MSRRIFENYRDGLTGEARSMVVEDGRIVAFDAHGIEGTKTDLGGDYLLPFFVDAHCHVLPTGLDLQKLHLGPAASREEVLDLVRERHATQPEGWLHAVHYDQNRYGGHLSRQDLDAISSSRPILLRHVNGHASVANSAALLAAGVDESTPDPAGGVYGRDESGRLNGLLLELAHEKVTASSPKPTFDEMVDAILRAGQSMRSLGIGCASDMMTGFFDLETEWRAYVRAAELGCPIAIRLFAQWRSVFGPRGIGADALAEYQHGDGGQLRVSGIKLFADGAIGSATAAIYGSYSGEPANGPVVSRRGHQPESGDRPVAGQLIYRPERLHEMVRTADAAGYPVAIHAIGDYATDLVMDAYERTDDPSRHRIEHAMILDDAQIDRIARLGCSVTFQPEFLLKFGHTYARQLGAPKAAQLKRTRSVLAAGIPLCFSSDRPIVSGDPWDGILSACNRPEGFDPSENIDRTTAIELYTRAAAAISGDDADFGSLKVGSRGEFQRFAEDPRLGPRPTQALEE